MNPIDQPLLTIEDQVAHLKSKGVTFNIMSEDEAISYLLESNNYFKLRAFRKNFERYQDGKNKDKYINLDFAMLCDLATIDMHLRYVILQISLNVEHFLKVKLLSKTEANHEDGYLIVSDFFDFLKKEDARTKEKHYTQLKNELKRNKDNPYCGGIIKACSDGYAIWAFIEVISLGMLLRFYHFAATRFQDLDMQNDFYIMLPIRELRNAAAHSNCIINDLRSTDCKYMADKTMIQKLRTVPKSSRRRQLSNTRVLQFCTLLYAHQKIGSPASQKSIHKLLTDLNERIIRHSDYYKNNTVLLGSYHFFLRIVDIFFG